MQPYGVTAQIINYSLPRERDSRCVGVFQNNSRYRRETEDVRETSEYVRIQIQKVVGVADYADISFHCAKYLMEYCLLFDEAFVD